jgi:hypothetical protein
LVQDDLGTPTPATKLTDENSKQRMNKKNIMKLYCICYYNVVGNSLKRNLQLRFVITVILRLFFCNFLRKNPYYVTIYTTLFLNPIPNDTTTYDYGSVRLVE